MAKKVDQVPCYVLVSGAATHAEDADLPGIYVMAVSTDGPVKLKKLTNGQQADIAKAVLSVFHYALGIEVPDDFDIRVFLVNGIELYQHDPRAELSVYASCTNKLSFADAPHWVRAHATAPGTAKASVSTTDAAAIATLTSALNCLLADVEAVACGVSAYGMPVKDPEHPFHKSVLQARKALAASSGAHAVARFMEELLASVETVGGIADIHGTRTLADLLYLQHAILTGGRLDYFPEESAVLQVVEALPSSAQWATFISPAQA